MLFSQLTHYLKNPLNDFPKIYGSIAGTEALKLIIQLIIWFGCRELRLRHFFPQQAG